MKTSENNNGTKRRRTVEIYFILYLAALIFLLPIKDNNKKNEENPLNIPPSLFSIHPMKTTLNCRLIIDSSSAKILSLDSMNTVIYNGNVEHVEYEFIVEDQSLRQKVSLNRMNEANSQYFRIEENNQQTANFFWNPPLYERQNKTYIVTVLAKAVLKSDNKDMTSKRLLEAKTQFSLNMIFVSGGGATGEFAGYYPGDSTSFSKLRNPIYDVPNIPSYFEVRPMFSTVDAVAERHWSNKLILYGMGDLTKDLTRETKIEVQLSHSDNGGTAFIESKNPSEIIVAGRTPSYGSMKVKCTCWTKYKTISFDFEVSPIKISQPKFEQFMYPEMDYVIIPNIPWKSGRDIKTVIMDGKTERAVSQQGEEFTFKPEISDIGKHLVLERYLNGELVNPKYQISVFNYPDPIIYDVQIVGNKTVNVITHSFGYVNTNENLSELEIEGNAYARELYGKSSKKPNDITNVQIFKSEPKNKEKPFSFKVRAKDKRGKVSQWRNFSF
ncbi:MAG: hypothetical protein WCT77_01565 [Bacteroidota bacterium]